MSVTGRFIGVLVAVLITATCSNTPDLQEPASAPITPLNYLPSLAGDYFEQRSRETGRRYHIYVRLPLDYAKAPPNIRYPIVYLLDGDSSFPMLAPEHLLLTYDEKLPEAIIVGIAYGSFDPSINKRDVDFMGPAEGVTPEGSGAPAFQRYLKTELIPVVEDKFRADPDRRILFGQSRGASFVLYSAFTDPDLFWGRIASNPTFKPDGDRLFGDAPTASRHDLGLVVTSGTRDRAETRAAALKWFQRWEGATGVPWTIKTVSIEGGTHAADAANSYRAGMLWLFERPSVPVTK